MADNDRKEEHITKLDTRANRIIKYINFYKKKKKKQKNINLNVFKLQPV